MKHTVNGENAAKCTHFCRSTLDNANVVYVTLVGNGVVMCVL